MIIYESFEVYEHQFAPLPQRNKVQYVVLETFGKHVVICYLDIPCSHVIARGTHELAWQLGEISDGRLLEILKKEIKYIKLFRSGNSVLLSHGYESYALNCLQVQNVILDILISKACDIIKKRLWAKRVIHAFRAMNECQYHLPCKLLDEQ